MGGSPVRRLLAVGSAVAVAATVGAVADIPASAAAVAGTWHQATTGGPAGLSRPSMAYLPATSTRPAQVLAFGGLATATNTFSDHLWSWDGSSWHDLGNGGPSARYTAAMAPDGHGHVLLYGGDGSSGNLRDLWEWDGKAWTEISADATSGATLASPVMAYDPRHADDVLLGSLGTTSMLTYVWNGSAMQAPSITQTPPTGLEETLAYDPATQQMVEYGGMGWNFSTFYDSTYLWTGSDWAVQSPATTPGGRAGGAMAFDPTTQQLVLANGANSASFPADTWAWRGTSWTQLAPSTQMPSNTDVGSTTSPAGVIVAGPSRTTTWRFAATDSTGPTATTSAPTAAFTLASAATVKYAATDNVTGVESYDVAWKRAGYAGQFSSLHFPAAWQRTTTTRETLTGLSPGYEYCFVVRAYDWSGNRGPWSSARCVERPLDDTALRASTHWTRATNSNFYLRTYTHSRTLGAKLTHKNVLGNRLAVVATTCPTCGKIALSIDGTHIASWSLVSAVTRRRHLFVTGKFRRRLGTIEIKIVSSAKTVQIDGFGVRAS